MAYLSEHCAFAHLTEDLVARLQSFSCEQEPAIADFFRDEAVLNERQLLSKSYCFYLPDTMEAVCAFCVSNSNISTRSMPADIKEDFVADIPDDKRRSFYPAAGLRHFFLARRAASWGKRCTRSSNARGAP